MDVGAIAFYQHEDRFKDILHHMGTSDRAFYLSDNDFEEKYGYSLQSVFHTLYQSDDMWGFVARKVNKRDGSTAYKLINHADSVKEVPADDIYFVLEMNDYNFTHWAEMESKRGIKHSAFGKRVLKTPSARVRANAIKQDWIMADRVLYQIVKTSSSDWGDYYSTSSFNNTKWMSEQPYYYDPPSMGSRNNYPQGMPTPTSPWENYYPNRSTLHAIPFSRDNIKPLSFKVLKHTSSLENQLCVFVNFPNGIPLMTS